MPGDSILVVNAGSSSVKFQVFSIGTDNRLSPFLKGQFDGIGTHPRLRATAEGNAGTVDQLFDLDKVPDVATAMQVAGAWIREQFDLRFAAVGHRVVHGGPKYDRPILVDETVLAELTRLGPLAPLHQPNNLAPINALRARFPDLPQVACFDTAFHRDHSAVADRFAIPERFYAEGVRRYGFHGLSYEYVAGRMREIAPDVAKGRVIVAHLGSGASMCALDNGRSIESTMGFTALDGLPMGTRPGQLDPGVVLYLLSEKGMSADAVQSMLYSECGLKGLSGISNDVRDLLDNATPGAALAMDYFIYRVSLHAGMLAAALGGLDAFVFTAGIGEKSAIVRQRISERLSWLGAKLDSTANDTGAPVISQAKSRVALMIVPTDEELMIARHTLAALSSDRTYDPAPKKVA
jgi:acetate kinase